MPQTKQGVRLTAPSVQRRAGAVSRLAVAKDEPLPGCKVKETCGRGLQEKGRTLELHGPDEEIDRRETTLDAMCKAQGFRRCETTIRPVRAARGSPAQTGR